MSYKENKSEERLHAIGKTKQGDYIKVIEYINANDILVEFIDNHHYITRTRWSEFKSGNLKNPYRESVYGVGIPGIKYPITDDSNNRTYEYQIWSDMLKRCYTNDYRIRNINYMHCIVSHEWLFYENFYEWLHSQENFNKMKNLKHNSAIDKDIIEKYNKIYSDKYCCLVPSYINNIFTRRERDRGDLPIGVTRHPKNSNLFIAGYSRYGKRHNIGVFNNELDAFFAYKNEKEAYIKMIADKEYALGNITKKCRDAMYTYEVEITD